MDKGNYVYYHNGSTDKGLRRICGFTMTQGLSWNAGRCLGLVGLGAPSPQKPMWQGKAKKEGVLLG